MKKLLVLMLLAAGLAGNLYCAPDGEALRAALPEGYALISVNPGSVPLAGKVRDPQGQVMTAYLIKNSAGQWVASANPDYFRSLDDVFARSEQADEAQAEAIQKRENAEMVVDQREQDVADDVVDDLR